MTYQSKKPALIDSTKTLELIEFIESIEFSAFRNTFNELDKSNWRFYPVKQSRGRCYYLNKTITIPVFAWSKGIDYLTYYIAHEMAHAIAGSLAKHGQQFMQVFKNICPKEYQHYELGYKPRNATAAGITAEDFPD